MRMQRPLITLLLAASVLLGQWLAAGHDPEHGLAGASHACAVCVYAHGAGSGALPSLPQLVLIVIAAAPISYVAAMPVAARARHHPIRGPPPLL
jgi:hypothetical protein